MKRQLFGASALCLMLAACGGDGGQTSAPPVVTPGPAPTPAPTPAPSPTPAPTPTPTPTPASFFLGATHFDDFNRSDTTPGTITQGPQGQAYSLYSHHSLIPDALGQIRNRRFYLPRIGIDGPRASYAMNGITGPLKRIGAIVEFGRNTEATNGTRRSVWAMLLSRTRMNFVNSMLHISGTDREWEMSIWTAGAIRYLQRGTMPALAQGARHRLDLRLDGDVATLTIDGTQTPIRDAEIATFTDARYVAIEHFMSGPTLDTLAYPAWYYQVEGAPLANPALYAPF